MTIPKDTQLQPYNRKRLWAVVLLVGPSALWLIAFLTFAIGNYMLGSFDMQSSGELRNTGPMQILFNISGFLIAAVAFLTWLPGLIVGTTLLVNSYKK